MEPQQPASSDGVGAGRGTDGPARPGQPGFTFADKRKVSPDGTLRPPATPTRTAGGSTELLEGVDAVPPIDAMPTGPGLAPEPNPHEALAAERLFDLQRLQAEYANYRKRVDRDRDTARANGVASMVESLLPVLDDIDLARKHGDLESGPFASIAEKLETVLARYGVERFGEPGTPFDPVVHDALMHVDEELAEGTDVATVVGVLQPGYKIGEKILRPARVSVADPR